MVVKSQKEREVESKESRRKKEEEGEIRKESEEGKTYHTHKHHIISKNKITEPAASRHSDHAEIPDSS